MSKLITELHKDVMERCVENQELMLDEEEMKEYLFQIFGAMSEEYYKIINKRKGE